MLDAKNLPVQCRRVRRDHIVATVSDLVGSLLYYDRKEDEDLPRGAIEEAIAAGEVTIDEIVDLFRREMTDAIEAAQDGRAVAMGDICTCGHPRAFHRIGTGNGVPVGEAYCDDRYDEPCDCRGFVDRMSASSEPSYREHLTTRPPYGETGAPYMLTPEQIDACQRIGRDEVNRRTMIGLSEFDALCATARTADEALAALASLESIITRTGGWLSPEDQDALRAARAVLGRQGR